MKLSMKEVIIMAGAMAIMTRVGTLVTMPTCDLIHISEEDAENQRQLVGDMLNRIIKTNQELEFTKSELVKSESEVADYKKELEEAKQQLALSKQVADNSSKPALDNSSRKVPDNLSNVQDGYKSVNVVVTFYTSLPSENGGYTGMNAVDGKLGVGSLAAPKDIPFGTTFVIDGLPADTQTNTFVVDDRGGAIKWIDSNTMKLDVYISRKQGENDSEYYRRVNNLGVYRVTAKYKLS